MVVECDQEVPKEGIRWLERAEGVLKVTYLERKRKVNDGISQYSQFIRSL